MKKKKNFRRCIIRVHSAYRFYNTIYFVQTTHAGPTGDAKPTKKLAQNIFATTFRQNIEARHKRTKKGGTEQQSGNVYEITDVHLTRLPHLLPSQHRHRKDGPLSPAPETPHTTTTTEIKTADVTSHLPAISLPTIQPKTIILRRDLSFRLSCQPSHPAEEPNPP